ncbi:hypothetical protein BDM02DRAFT_1054294 [Thelephora ganbajun]|uniref:Uncharacterized protein n=1 Tax=Thelephora ganbajun TaxID=370292 RepID=A0ACB6Z3V9_THEGA|nr:hypothetical protein BDM02DRAFT_1054294 [Thelephora ganbajun]
MENPQRNKQCPACPKTYVSVSAAQRHIRKKHPHCTEPLMTLSHPIPTQTIPTAGATKPPKQKVCTRCPHRPVFPSKAARKEHVKEVHTTKCPICLVGLIKQPLATHLWNIHGIRSGVQVANQTAPQFASISAPAELPYATSFYQASGELEEPSRQTNFSPQDSEDSVAFDTYDAQFGRFYCQEYDCGRGFSSEVHLESHKRFFHPKKPTRTTKGEEEPTALSNGILEVTEKPTEDSPAYFSSASTISSPRSRERVMWDGPDSPGAVESPVPVPLLEGYQGVNLNAEQAHQYTFGSPTEPPVITQGDVNVPPAVTASTPLSLRCRMCDAPPTVGTRPTVTMCGHLFCSLCITQYVISTSRCPCHPRCPGSVKV